jgi:hypothetical protein
MVSFPQALPPKRYMHLLSPHTCNIPCQSQFSRFYHANNIWWGTKHEAPHCIFSYSSVTSSCLHSNIFLSLCFSLIMKDQDSHPHKIIGRVMVLCILVFILQESTLEDKILDQLVAGTPCVQPALNFFMDATSICYGCSQISELRHTFKRFINCLYIVTLFCILFTRHKHTPNSTNLFLDQSPY